MKHMSQSVQEFTTLGKSAEETPSISPLSDSSTRSNKRGKESHRLKLRRQPWQISNTRRISTSSASASKNMGSRQAMGWRVGAPGSASIVLAYQVALGESRSSRAPGPVTKNPAVCSSVVINQKRLNRIQCFLKAPGMRLFGLGECFKPIGYLIKAFVAGGARHTRIHIRIFMGFASNGGC